MSRLQEYEDYMAGIGGPKLTAVTPCCNQRITVLVPKFNGHVWDGTKTCPGCAAKLRKTATKDTAKLVLM